MGAPAEPLLPPDAPPPSRLKLWLLVGGAGAALIGITLVVLLRPSTPATPEVAPVVEERPTTPKAPGNGAARPKDVSAEEQVAKELYAAAEAFEAANPADREEAATRYRKVFQAHPTTSWGKKADRKQRQIQESQQESLEGEFRSTMKGAQSLAAAGHYADAVEAVRAYLKEQAREPLRRQAEREIATLENASRQAFNALASRAAAMTKNGEYDQAAALFEALKAGAIPDVARKCDEAIAQLREAAKASETSSESGKVEEARKAFREGAAPKVLALLRARRYEEGLKEFEAAAADPAAAPLQAELARERAALASAAAFWEAFLKGLRSRMNQELSVALTGPKEARVAGKLVRLDADRAALETAEGTAEVVFDKIHADQVVGWTIGKTLAADDATTYVKAALFFFLDGRDDLARLYLATAKEMGADLSDPERVFREGFFRATRPK